VAFEVGIPMAGLAVGAPLARPIGDVADYMATAVSSSVTRASASIDDHIG
jgi:hypothetical protein